MAITPIRSESILIVNEDVELLGLLRATFQLRGSHVLCAQSSMEAKRLIHFEGQRAHTPALAILDAVLPDHDGLSLGQELLRLIPYLSLIYLSRSNDLERKVQAMMMGADDYIVHPFEWVELVARVERTLRHIHEPRMVCLTYEHLEIDLIRGRVRICDQDVPLSMSEYRFLCCLAHAQGNVVSCMELAEYLWPTGVSASEEDVVKKVKLRLEAKLDRVTQGAKVIHNVPRTGYYLSWRAPTEMAGAPPQLPPLISSR